MTKKMTDTIKIFLRGRLNGCQRNRVKGLLNMMYTPKELAEDIGINLDQVYRVYIVEGCPHLRDKKNHILINGIDFKNWYEERYKKTKLEKDQAYCVSCKRIVSIENPEIARSGSLIFYLAKCPFCGNKATRIIDCKRKKNDQ